MTQSPQVRTAEDAPDAKSISRNVARRRIAIACGATAGVTFILAGLLAGPAVFPGVLDDLRERELLPVHILGGGGTHASGQNGSAGSSAAPFAGSSTTGSTSTTGSPASGAPGGQGTPGTTAPAAELDSPPPSLILPGGINLSDVLKGTTGTVDGTLEGAKDLIDGTLKGAEGVLDNPETLPGFIDKTVDDAEDIINNTTPEGAPDTSDLPIEVPNTSDLPIDTAPLSPVTSLLEPATNLAPTPSTVAESIPSTDPVTDVTDELLSDPGATLGL